jgi:hypothetical protein
VNRGFQREKLAPLRQECEELTAIFVTILSEDLLMESPAVAAHPLRIPSSLFLSPRATDNLFVIIFGEKPYLIRSTTVEFTAPVTS